MPLFARQQQGYFDSYEVAVMLQFLRILDNPLQDIPMAAVLLSPMVGYTPAQLAQLRSTGPEQPLYRLLLHRQDPADQEFLSLYRRLRMQAALLPVDRLLRLIYDTTGFYYMGGGDGGRPPERGQPAAVGELRPGLPVRQPPGLGGFVRYLDRAIQRQERFECANVQTGEAVELMTIHKSKGLEYPICFVAQLEHRFNQQDLQQTVLLHGELGMAMPVIRPQRGQRYDNLPLVGVRQAIRRENLSEELRVLYVAMTRAKEKADFSGFRPGAGAAGRFGPAGTGEGEPLRLPVPELRPGLAAAGLGGGSLPPGAVKARPQAGTFLGGAGPGFPGGQGAGAPGFRPPGLGEAGNRRRPASPGRPCAGTPPGGPDGGGLPL